MKKLILSTALAVSCLVTQVMASAGQPLIVSYGDENQAPIRSKNNQFEVLELILNAENPYGKASTAVVHKFASMEEAFAHAAKVKCIDFKKITENSAAINEILVEAVTNVLADKCGHLLHVNRVKELGSLLNKAFDNVWTLANREVGFKLNDINAQRVVVGNDVEALEVANKIKNGLSAEAFEVKDLFTQDKIAYNVPIIFRSVSALGTEIYGELTECQVWPKPMAAWLDWQHDRTYKGDSVSESTTNVMLLMARIMSQKAFTDKIGDKKIGDAYTAYISSLDTDEYNLLLASSFWKRSYEEFATAHKDYNKEDRWTMKAIQEELAKIPNEADRPEIEIFFPLR